MNSSNQVTSSFGTYILRTIIAHPHIHIKGWQRHTTDFSTGQVQWRLAVREALQVETKLRKTVLISEHQCYHLSTAIKKIHH